MCVMDRKTYVLAAFTVELLELLVKRALGLQLQMNLVQLQCGQGVLDGIVRVGLDVLVEDEPRKETERQPSLAVLQVVQVNGVDDLFWWDMNV